MEDEMNRRDETTDRGTEQQPLSTSDIAQGRRNEEPASITDRRSSQGMATVDGTPEGSLREGMNAHAQHGEPQAPLMGEESLETYSARWQTIQGHFVDEPKGAVEEADGLVAEVIQELATTFASQRKDLESKWQSGGEASTDDLLLALRQYKSFFQRLLAA
jgi:peptidoglycan hydrolase-like protein with peptidoglycan-binding domain